MLRVAGRGTRGSPRDALGSRPHTAALLYMAVAAPQLEFQLSRPIIWVSLNPSDCEKNQILALFYHKNAIGDMTVPAVFH